MCVGNKASRQPFIRSDYCTGRKLDCRDIPATCTLTPFFYCFLFMSLWLLPRKKFLSVMHDCSSMIIYNNCLQQYMQDSFLKHQALLSCSWSLCLINDFSTKSVYLGENGCYITRKTVTRRTFLVIFLTFKS